jgi:hypothetical protein
MLYENLLAVVIGALLVTVSFFAKGISYGMPPHAQKPRYPATPAARMVLLSVGLLPLAVGLLGVVRR